MVNALGKATAAQKAAKTRTPVGVRTPGRTDEVQNNTGGFVFEVSNESRLNRFMILGTEGGSYYADEKALTNANMNFVLDMIREDEDLVRKVAVDVSVNGRAYKNSPALYTIAALLVFGKQTQENRRAVAQIARTSTHLFEFAQYIKNIGGWGRAKRGAVADWYTGKSAEDLAYQVVKYRQRNGWTHRDLFRLSHPRGVDARVAAFVLKGESVGDGNGDIIDGFHAVQAAGSEKEVVRILNTYKSLPWEAIPTQFLKSVKVWQTLFANGQLNGQALVRNVTRMARIGAFDDMVFAGEYAARLTDMAMIKRTRLHPINFLNAAVVFEEGQFDRNGYDGWYSSRKKDWKTNSKVLKALQDGFHLSFGAVEPSGKRHLLGVDVSGSMAGAAAVGIDLTAAQVSAAMAMTVVRTEPYSVVYGFADRFVDLGITESDSLSAVMNKVQMHNFGSTDMSLPMEFARRNGIKVDTFGVFTDNEINRGIKPTQALQAYRQATGIDARLGVFGVSATEFTIADPQDRGQMDFVGFDASAPKIFRDFSAGLI